MFRQHSRQSPSHKSQKRIIFLPILERKGESSKKQGSSGTREGQVCSMKVANPTPATRFGVTQQKFSRHRAASKPPMRNAVTLVVLEHVRTCKYPIPAVSVDVKEPPKNLPKSLRGQKVGSSALQNAMPASRTQERPRRREANDEIAPNAPTPPDPPKTLRIP